jgi:xylan 1,4-beta-xylosidase
LNKLGQTELTNTDTRSWACKNNKGDVQLLLWDYTYTLPDSTNNQNYYNKDLPAKSKGKVKINLSHIPAGKYTVEVYKVGYRTNDVYTGYLDMGKPNQLNKQQVDKLKKQNDGLPVITRQIEIKPNSVFSEAFDIRENDVYLINLVKK